MFLLGTARSVRADVITYTIEALIDGRDQLHIDRNTLQWVHVDFAAPGRISGNNFPTYITTTLNGYTVLDRFPWVPDWPLPPPDEIRFFARSSTFTQLTPAVPTEPFTVTLEAIQARHGLRFILPPQPNRAGALEFDDNPPPGADWYIVRLTFTTQSTPEPNTLALFGLSIVGLGCCRRVRRRWRRSESIAA